MKHNLIGLIFLFPEVYKYRHETLSFRYQGFGDNSRASLILKSQYLGEARQVSRLNLSLEFIQTSSPLPNRVKFISQ